MKRKLTYLALPLMGAAFLSVCSCGGSKKGADTAGDTEVAAAGNVAPFVTENVGWTDSITVGDCKAVALSLIHI